MSHDLKLHYQHCHRKALASGFDSFAHSIAVLYFAEFGEAMPADSPHALAGSRGGRLRGMPSGAIQPTTSGFPPLGWLLGFAPPLKNKSLQPYGPVFLGGC